MPVKKPKPEAPKIEPYMATVILPNGDLATIELWYHGSNPTVPPTIEEMKEYMDALMKMENPWQIYGS